MDAIAAAGSLLVDVLTEERKPEGVALPMQQFYQHCSGIDGESELVWMVHISMVLQRKIHRAALVNHQLATQVGLLFELFDVESVGAAKEVPVDVLGAFAGVVLSIVGEFDGEAMEGAFVPAGDEAFYHLAGEKVQRLVAGDLLLQHFVNGGVFLFNGELR